MGVDPRHDHSFRLPRPDRSASLGTPNACNQCHAKQTVQWAIDAMQRWYPTPKPGYQSFAESFALADRDAPGSALELLKVVRDPQQSAMARASAIARLVPHLSPRTLPAIADALADNSALVRLAAVEVMARAEDSSRAHYLAPLLSDPRRAVRIEAARALAGSAERLLTVAQQRHFANALGEYVAAQQFNADRPEAHGNLGNLFQSRGDAAGAEREFRAALTRDPTFLPGWVNLAEVLRSAGKASDAIAVLRQGLQKNANAAELEHALGLALIRSGDRQQALKLLAAATKHAPRQVRNAYVYAVAQHDTGDAAGALKTLEAALKQRPYERELLLALTNYRRERGDFRGAADAASVLRQIDPDNITYQRLAAEIAVNAGPR
jgi:tetratricopeptide (TPR) repeat protein